VEIDQRIPDLSDKELESLHANAVRLAESGSVAQKQQSERLLPLLVATLEERKLAKAAAKSALIPRLHLRHSHKNAAREPINKNERRHRTNASGIN